MTTLIRLILASILSIFMLSCNFTLNLAEGTKGNGTVIKTDRPITEDVKQIQISQGLELYITQSDASTLSVEADENLHDLIKTEIENHTLKIYTSDNIKSAASKKILLSVNSISGIKATSGSAVYANTTIKEDTLDLNATRGANISLDVITEHLNCHSTSGSSIKLSGTTHMLKAQATSGSRIKASDLIANTSKVQASSGADISTNTAGELTASASSGGNINYSGEPKKVNTAQNALGSVIRE